MFRFLWNCFSSLPSNSPVASHCPSRTSTPIAVRFNNPLLSKAISSSSPNEEISCWDEGIFFVLATPTYLNDSPRSAQELIFERDVIKKSCKQHDFGVNPFSDFLPEKVAIDFKEERWKQTLQQMGIEKFKNLLNTPPEIPNPFYLYGEDVKAIARLGFKPGPKAKVIQSQKDLDYLYDFLN